MSRRRRWPPRKPTPMPSAAIHHPLLRHLRSATPAPRHIKILLNAGKRSLGGHAGVGSTPLPRCFDVALLSLSVSLSGMYLNTSITNQPITCLAEYTYAQPHPNNPPSERIPSGLPCLLGESQRLRNEPTDPPASIPQPPIAPDLADSTPSPARLPCETNPSLPRPPPRRDIACAERTSVRWQSRRDPAAASPLHPLAHRTNFNLGNLPALTPCPTPSSLRRNELPDRQPRPPQPLHPQRSLRLCGASRGSLHHPCRPAGTSYTSLFRQGTHRNCGLSDLWRNHAKRTCC